MTPIISVVTGTYNRLESLIRMVRSVRERLPFPIAYEIVVVDGGSTDGTQVWCKAQPNIVLIEHGELRGAIRAFCDGANVAQGKYIVLANDDIEFLPGSILAAFTCLEGNERCGGVAFMDNRPVLNRPVGAFRAQMMPAVRNGQSASVVYAQVGMFRRELGDVVGWWGADDPVMGQARTYGGDNWLSARIWEAGYTVDIVKGAMCLDNVIADGLREKNANAHDRAYAQAYPRGPLINSKPLDIDPTAEQLRVLYLPIFEPHHMLHRQHKRGLREALGRIGVVWEWDYLDENKGAIAEDLQAFNPHLILTQFHDARWGNLIDQLRTLCPQALIVNWNGDARGLVDGYYLTMLRKVDMQLVTNAAALRIYEANGIRAAYWQIGFEPRGIVPDDAPTHDVVFLGNCYSAQRQTIERVLRNTKHDIGLYGFGWNKADGNCLYDFGAGEAIYQRATIALADSFEDGKDEVYAFTSNRLIEAMASGAFLLQQHVDGLDEYNGIEAGKHYIEWNTIDELPGLLDYWLGKAAKTRRREVSKTAQTYALEHFSFDAQIKRLLTEILPEREAEHA